MREVNGSGEYIFITQEMLLLLIFNIHYYKTSLNCVISFEFLEEPGSKVFTWKMSCNQSSFLYYKTILTIFENRREYEEKKTEIVGNKAKG